MLSAWKMLAPVDLSQRPEEAMRHAVSMGAALSAGVDLLHVVHPGSPNELSGHAWPDSSASAEQRNIRRHVATGDPATAIAAWGDMLDPDLVLVTSRRFGKWNRLWRRSVTDELMRLMRRPVCLISADSVDEEFRFRRRRILCVVGLGGGETALIACAQEWATRADAELILLHVVPQPDVGLLRFSAEQSTRPLSAERAARDLRSLVQSLRVPALTSVMVGDPDKCIPLSAREHSADLVLMSRAWGRSPAAYSHCLPNVFSRLRCPLITVPVDGLVELFRSGTDTVRMKQKVKVPADAHAVHYNAH